MSRMRRMDRACIAGAAGLGTAVLEPARQGVLAHRQPDGGFRGRAGTSDAWYTAFSLRCLELTGGIPAEIAGETAQWLASQPTPTAIRPALDHATIALLSSGTRRSGKRLKAEGGRRKKCFPVAIQAKGGATRDELSSDVERSDSSNSSAFRLPPSAFAAASAYDAFALAIHADLTHQPQPTFDPAPLRRGDGFAESLTHPQPQVPATAAVVTSLLLRGQSDPAACRFLASQQTDLGGIRVHADAPMPDLLSTATAAWALAASRQLHLVDRAGLARFAVACRTPAGFAAIPGDPQSDPEYTWYGLTLLALLRRHAAPGLVGWLRRHGWWLP